MTVTVLVPSDEGRAALADLENASLVVYDPDEPMPGEAVDAEVLVVPPRRAPALLAAMHDLPKLRLVQTLSAGTWTGPGRWPRARSPPTQPARNRPTWCATESGEGGR